MAANPNRRPTSDELMARKHYRHMNDREYNDWQEAGSRSQSAWRLRECALENARYLSEYLEDYPDFLNGLKEEVLVEGAILRLAAAAAFREKAVVLEAEVMKAIIITSRGCWRLLENLDKRHYASLNLDGRRVAAHRFMYVRKHKRRITANFVIDHLCNAHNCVNPDHLEEVTSAENVRRGHQRRKASPHLPGDIECLSGHDLKGADECPVCAADLAALAVESAAYAALEAAYHEKMLRRDGAHDANGIVWPNLADNGVSAPKYLVPL